jgi:hypothetical protein
MAIDNRRTMMVRDLAVQSSLSAGFDESLLCARKPRQRKRADMKLVVVTERM